MLDSGEGITHAVPVYEGYAIPHATVRADFGGRDITNHLQLLLRKSGHLFHTTAENEVVREIKEVKCYVTYDPDQEEQLEMEHGKTYAMHQLPDGTNISIGFVYVFALPAREHFTFVKNTFTLLLLPVQYPPCLNTTYWVGFRGGGSGGGSD